MDFVDKMWDKFCLYYKSENLDEDTKSIVKSLFYTLFFLIIDEGNCSTKCEYWCRFMQLTREYSFLPGVEEKFNDLISRSSNEKVIKYFNEFAKIKQGYGVFFANLYTCAELLILKEFGLRVWEKCKL